VIAGLKPYPDYQDTGHDWLGSMPSHWSLLRAKRLFREVDERSKTGKEELLSVSHLTGVTPRRLKNVTMFMAESNVGHKVCRPGDLVINTLWAWMAALGVTRHTGIVSPAYGVYRPTEDGGILPAYADHLLRTPLYAAEYQRRSTGVNSSRLRLYPEQFLRIPVMVPSPDEQAAIVRFLDLASGRLERAIRAKRKVISLLTEQKQATVQRGVSCGLDGGVTLKTAGIPWLGDIPTHWQISRLKHCVSRIEQGWSPQCDAQPSGEHEWGVLKVGCVNKETFSWRQNKKLPDSLRPDVSLEIRDGDILVSRANTRELLGLAALAEKPRAKLILSDKLFRFRAKGERFDSAFLVLTLRAKASRAQIESSTNGASSSMQNIGQAVLKNLWLAVPALEEQKAIVEQVAIESQPLNEAISRLEREIELLREYRTRLVVDVVTGKLDVREAAANLPADIGAGIEAEPDDDAEDAELIDEEATEA
jgi:type I restriction enzyme S subunit